LLPNDLYTLLATGYSLRSADSVGKTYSFAILACAVGCCELQMCMAYALA